MFGLYSRNSHRFHVVNQGPNVHEFHKKNRASPCGDTEESRSSTVMKKMHSPESSPLLGGLGKFRFLWRFEVGQNMEQSINGFCSSPETMVLHIKYFFFVIFSLKPIH